MRVLVTGAAGFIGFHVAGALARMGHQVYGVDNLVDYYPVRLKEARLTRLGSRLVFTKCDLADPERTAEVVKRVSPDVIVHLAAQAGVRYSLEKPFEYLRANSIGHVSVLEAIRHHAPEALLIYASSSSVYGSRNNAPFKEEDRVDFPSSLYAATKRCNELASSTYSELFGLRQIGLRFFTVYGAWGRPDMAYWSFTDAILNGREIILYDQGRGERDFTHVNDIVTAICAMVERPVFGAGLPHNIYNLGNSDPIRVTEMVRVLEEVSGKQAKIRLVGAQAGDVPLTSASTQRVSVDYGFAPSTPLSAGLSDFVSWFRSTPEAYDLYSL